MSKTAAVLIVGGLAVGAVVLIASTSKASPKPPASPFQFGQGTTVQGRGGAVWIVAPVLNPGPVAAGVKVMGVFPMNISNNDGTPKSGGVAGGDLVMMFAQQGDDMNSRAFVSSPPGTNGGTLERARQDFGV
jgi:hypothetical protein